MRFHKLKLRNLNALYGDHTVDFDRDVMGASVFLIVGPTGAGKSTLLDAICLALFGQTPRLERRVGKSETDVEHVMSIGTYDCLAELDFSMVGADGSREFYRAVWSMRRAHEKADGTPQRPERSLHRMTNGTLELLVSDHRQKFFEPVFNKALRDLSVEDFKRSILLAQGDFAAFLKASESEKASILERVTSTDVYLRLGKRAAERRREAELSWREIEKKGAGIRVLGMEERQIVENQLEVTSEGVLVARELLRQAQASLEVLRQHDSLQTELQKALEKREFSKALLDKVAESRDRLALNAKLSEVSEVVLELDELSQERLRTLEEIRRLSVTWDRLLQEGYEAEKKWRVQDVTFTRLSETWRLEEPRIRKAEELQNLVEVEEKSLRELLVEVEKLETERAEKTHIVESFREFEAEQKRIFEDHTRTLEGLGEDEFGRIEAQWEAAVEPQIRQVQERTDVVRECLEKLGAAQTLAGQIEVEWQEKQVRLEPANRKIARATERVNMLTVEFGGASNARDVLELKVSALQRKIASLKEAMTLNDQIKGWQSEQRDVRERMAKLQVELDGLEKDLAKEKTLSETLGQLQASLEENIHKSEQLLALSGLRGELSLGEPCPLCGSPVHPFCDSDELGQMDSRIQKEAEASRQKLIEVRQSTLEARDTFQRTSHSVTSKRTSMQHLESRVVSIMGDIETSTRRFSNALLDAGFPPLEEYRLRDSAVLAEEVRLAVEHFDHASTTYAQVKKALQALNEATQIRDALVDEDFVKQRAAAALEVQAARDACRNAEAEKTRAEEALLVRLNSVQAFAKRYESDVALDREELERFMKEHRSKILAVREELREFEATRQSIESKRKQVAEIQEVLVSLGSKIEERTKSRPTLERAIAERKEAIAQIVGTQTPVSLRAGYERDLELQAKALEVLRREKEAASATQERWMGQATSMRDRWLSIEKSWTQCMDTFQRHLESLKMTEEEVRLGILPEERRRSLEQQVRAAELAMAHAEEGVKVLEGQLAALGEIETDPENRARLALEVENQEASLRELTLSLGGLRERLSVDDGAREALKGLREEMESAERAMDVWARVGGLIGVNEGASFREFAQTLNLEGLVQRANTQLENLNPRYNLVVAEREGLPTLQFDVIDRYQGNVRRPLTTLSGGESFLVSLALALGLAEFRSLDFPVEILLLDEGFGTLDQDALRMAVSTLHRLEARSAKQVAIISHVEALKEMVRVQIRVEPKGFGRSGLTVVR